MAGDPNPTLSRLILAARLRELRLQAGRSIEDAASELMCSVAKISRMETGGRGVQPRDVRDLCRLYGVSEAVRDELAELLSRARIGGWWKDFRSLDERVAFLFALEDAASMIRMFEAYRVPGLLQTAAFTEALIRDLRPPGEISEEWIAEAVTVRRLRQKRIESGELHLHAVIDEAALTRPIGGDAVMSDQIDRLIAATDRPNVTLQVIPFSRGPHPGMDGSFEHMSFAERIDDMVHIEAQYELFNLDKADEVVRYRTVFDDLAARYALDPRATVVWLEKNCRLRRGGYDT